MGRPAHQLARRALGVLLAALLGACSTLPVSVPGSRGDTETAGTAGIPPPASASQALLEQSRASRADGDLTAAEITIERAVRIEPNDPELWLEYGYVQFARGDFEQAGTLAQRARNLAGNDSRIQRATSRLIADANRERNRLEAAAAREAERQ